MPDKTGDHDHMLDITTYNPATGGQVTIRCGTGSDTHNNLVAWARRGELDIVDVTPVPGPSRLFADLDEDLDDEDKDLDDDDLALADRYDRLADELDARGLARVADLADDALVGD
jgi:hypothetical protein